MRHTWHRRKKKSKLKSFLKILSALLFLAALVLIFIPEPTYKECFKNLQDLQLYASKTNENTPMENNDTLRPEFTNYYKSLIPKYFKKVENKAFWLLSKINLATPPIWDVTAFKYLVEELGTMREKASLKDNFVYRIENQPNSKFVIFGNMQGAFHSLVRCMTKLKELGIIDDSLKITQPQNYIIFMGDVVDRSPFTLETLTAVMRLVQVNPNNVIYLRGNHETNNYWQEHTLKTELQIRAAKISNQTVPLEKEVNLFFNTLPLAIYLTIPGTTNDFVRISDAGRANLPALTESNFAELLIKKTNPGPTYFALKEKPEISDIKINIKVIICGEKKRKTFQKMEGLRLLAPDIDSVAWNILSCPNVVYQKALDFFYDSFAIVYAAEQLTDWEITLFNRDLRTSNPFKETKYNFVSGLDAETHKKVALAPPQVAPQPIAHPAQATPPPQQVVQQAPPVQAQPAPPIQPITPSQPVTQTPPSQPQSAQQAQQPIAQTPVAQPQMAQPQTQLLQVVPPTPQETQQQQQASPPPKIPVQ
jgi:hypothetical protein